MLVVFGGALLADHLASRRAMRNRRAHSYAGAAGESKPADQRACRSRNARLYPWLEDSQAANIG
jgi:hypothetical protein